MYVVISGIYGDSPTEVVAVGPFVTEALALKEVQRQWADYGFGPAQPPESDYDNVIWSDEAHSYDCTFWRIVELKG